MTVQTHAYDEENGGFFFIMGVGLNSHNPFKFGALRTTRRSKNIQNTQTLQFFEKNFSLSSSHQYMRFKPKKAFFWPKPKQKWWETDKIKIV